MPSVRGSTRWRRPTESLGSPLPCPGCDTPALDSAPSAGPERTTMPRTPRSILTAAAAVAAASVVMAAPAAPRAPGIDLAGIDPTVLPGDDFFRYANGAWLKSTEIPADRSTYGTGAILTELNTRRTAELVRDAAAHAAAGSDARKIGDYYASFMDEARIEQLKLRPLAVALERIDVINDRRELAQALGATLRADVDVLNSTRLHTPNLFGLWVAQDLDDPQS